MSSSSDGGERSARVIQHQLMGRWDTRTPSAPSVFMTIRASKKSNVSLCVIDRLESGHRKSEKAYPMDEPRCFNEASRAKSTTNSCDLCGDSQ